LPGRLQPDARLTDRHATFKVVPQQAARQTAPEDRGEIVVKQQGGLDADARP